MMGVSTQAYEGTRCIHPKVRVLNRGRLGLALKGYGDESSCESAAQATVSSVTKRGHPFKRGPGIYRGSRLWIVVEWTDMQRALVAVLRCRLPALRTGMHAAMMVMLNMSMLTTGITACVESHRALHFPGSTHPGVKAIGTRLLNSTHPEASRVVLKKGNKGLLI